jgi:hypothetical protein
MTESITHPGNGYVNSGTLIGPSSSKQRNISVLGSPGHTEAASRRIHLFNSFFRELGLVIFL